MCWIHYTQTDTNNINKTCAFLQTTEGKLGALPEWIKAGRS